MVAEITSSHKKDIFVITAAFGEHIKTLHPSVTLQGMAITSIVYTDNLTLKDECQQKGWTFCYIKCKLALPSHLHNTQAIHRTSIENSLCSKEIKFLAFLSRIHEADINIGKHDYLIYVDHKFELLPHHVDILLNTTKNTQKPIIIRTTPHPKTIDKEIEIASSQKRYAYAMNNTRRFIENVKKTQGLQGNNIVCNTGLILYDLTYKHLYQGFLDNIYHAMYTLAQPECQIFWCLYAEKYKQYIAILPWQDFLPMKWCIPLAKPHRMSKETFLM